MRYIISGNKVYRKLWFIPNGCANISDIVSVERSYVPLSAPAASLKRLHIRFETDSFYWLISPDRENEFIEALKSVNPGIRVSIPETKGIGRILDLDI